MVFCPVGRSSNILATLGKELRQLAATGAVSEQVLADMQNITLIRSRNAGCRPTGTAGWATVMLVLFVALSVWL